MLQLPTIIQAQERLEYWRQQSHELSRIVEQAEKQCAREELRAVLEKERAEIGPELLKERWGRAKKVQEWVPTKLQLPKRCPRKSSGCTGVRLRGTYIVVCACMMSQWERNKRVVWTRIECKYEPDQGVVDWIMDCSSWKRLDCTSPDCFYQNEDCGGDCMYSFTPCDSVNVCGSCFETRLSCPTSVVEDGDESTPSQSLYDILLPVYRDCVWRK